MQSVLKSTCLMVTFVIIINKLLLLEYAPDVMLYIIA